MTSMTHSRTLELSQQSETLLHNQEQHCPDTTPDFLSSNVKVMHESSPECGSVSQPSHLEDDSRAVINNFRDLAQCLDVVNMKEGVLFRSGRPSTHSLKSLELTFVKKLKIVTVIDLREDDLTNGLEGERQSRMAMEKIYQRSEYSALKHPHKKDELIENKQCSKIQHGPKERSLHHAPSVSASAVSSTNTTKDAHAHAHAQQQSSQQGKRRVPRKKHGMIYVCNVITSREAIERMKFLAQEKNYLAYLAMYKAIDSLFGTKWTEYKFCQNVASSYGLLASYVDMLKFCMAQIRHILDIVLESEMPILFHCSLGKDRTGIVAMLLSHVLGASEEAICEDYAASTPNTHKETEEVQQFILQKGLSPDFASCKKETMFNLIAYCRQEYGSLDGYLDKVGFKYTQRERMRNKFLKPLSQDSNAECFNQQDP